MSDAWVWIACLYGGIGFGLCAYLTFIGEMSNVHGRPVLSEVVAVVLVGPLVALILAVWLITEWMIDWAYGKP